MTWKLPLVKICKGCGRPITDFEPECKGQYLEDNDDLK